MFAAAFEYQLVELQGRVSRLSFALPSAPAPTVPVLADLWIDVGDYLALAGKDGWSVAQLAPLVGPNGEKSVMILLQRLKENNR